MAAPLRKVSLDYHQTLLRVRVGSGVSLRQHRDPVVPFRVTETPSDGNTPPSHATQAPSSETHTIPPEVQSDYYSPFLRLSERIYPPGLYTAIAHNGPLRTRIQCFWSELDEFWWHLRHARVLLFGILAALYHLVLLVVWHTFVFFTHPFIKTYKRCANCVASVIFFTRRVRRAMSLRYVVMDWLLPVLDKIRKIALDAIGTEGLSTDTGGSPVRPDSEGNVVAPDSEMSRLEAHSAQVRNGGTIIGILLSERDPPTLLDHPAPTTRHHIGISTGTYPSPADHHASAPSITILKARIREMEW